MRTQPLHLQRTGAYKGRVIPASRLRPAFPQMLEMGALLGRVRRLVRHRVQQQLEAEGGSMQDWLVLKHLAQEGPRSQRELADLTAQHPAALSRQLDQMEEAGLVRRVRDRADRRCLRAAATARGLRKLAALNPQVAAGVLRALGPLSSAELRELRGLLRKVLDFAAPADYSR